MSTDTTSQHHHDRLARTEQPLSGIKVLDLTRLLPGAWCTQMLVDLGAEVIKVEQPGVGDYWRWVEPHVEEQGYAFLALNRGKKSITIDLKNAAGKEALLALCETADVLLEGFRPGVMARLGLGPDELTRRFPRLVYCALTGFGQDGPDAQLAAHDLNYLGLTGVLHYVSGSQTQPRTTALPVGDISGGAQMALTGILAALLNRGRTGRGRVVDISITDGLLSLVSFMSSRWNVKSEGRAPVPFDEPFNKPFYTVYETQDGGHMVVGAYEPKFWNTVCEVLELPEWSERQWATGDEEERMRNALAAKFRTRTREEWTQTFSEHEACVTPVLTLSEASRSPQAKARGMTITVEDPVEGTLEHIACPVRFEGVAYSTSAPCPRLGENTEELLASVGYDTQQIADLRLQKAI
ncbi:CoA transferase [Alcaligenaceae bacterium]|nr:CoA transferase [Alcaligenaceae bacterium]